MFDLVSLMKTNLENLTIWDKNFRLLPFQKITEQFSTSKLRNTKCELCSKEVDPKESQYVFHYLVTFDCQLRATPEPSIAAMVTETDLMSWKRICKCQSQLKEGTPFTTYVIGQGIQTICNVRILTS